MKRLPERLDDYHTARRAAVERVNRMDLGASEANLAGSRLKKSFRRVGNRAFRLLPSAPTFVWGRAVMMPMAAAVAFAVAMGVALGLAH